jgi:aminopeptidase N
MTARRAAATLAATALLLGGLSACTDADSSAAPEAEPTTSSAVDPAGNPGPEVDDPALDAAVNEPLEDSVYPDVGDPSVDSLHYGLDLTWDPETRTLDGVEELVFRSTGDAGHVQLDLEPQLEVSAVQVDGGDAEFEHTGKDLVVSGDFVADERYLLTVSYSGSPQPVQAPTTRADFSTSGFTATPSGEAWTMQEPFGAYTWYAVNDQPSDKAFYDFTLTTPSPWVGVANGELTSREEVDGNTVTTWHLDSRTSSYLVTVAFGEFTMREDESASGVPITYWVPKAHADYADALDFTPDALAWVESKLGPYPWSSLGIMLVDSMSGMETQTMITLGATDYATKPEVIVHEIVHQWYGDQVTPTDWRDVWMSEGMTMYLQLTYQAETTGSPLEEIMRRVVRPERQSRRKNGPPAAYDPGTFAELNIYYGPALMWDQVRRRVGDERFWAMVKAWPTVDKDGGVDREEFLPWVEEQTGTELSDLFDGWLFAKRSPKFS